MLGSMLLYAHRLRGPDTGTCFCGREGMAIPWLWKLIREIRFSIRFGLGRRDEDEDKGRDAEGLRLGLGLGLGLGVGVAGAEGRGNAVRCTRR